MDKVSKKLKNLLPFVAGFIAMMGIVYFGSVLVRCLASGETGGLCIPSLFFSIAFAFALAYLITEAD